MRQDRESRGFSCFHIAGDRRIRSRSGWAYPNTMEGTSVVLVLGIIRDYQCLALNLPPCSTTP